MKKNFALFLTAFSLVLAANSHGAGIAGETNVVRPITIQLTAIYNNATTGAIAQNLSVITAGGKHSLFGSPVTNLTHKSATYTINTSDIINILTTNTAPKGSTLVQVDETNYSNYVAVRHNGTNVLVLEGQIYFNRVSHAASPSYVDVYSATGNTSIGTAEELMTFRIDTPSCFLESTSGGKRVYGTPYKIGPVLIDNVVDTLNISGAASNYLSPSQIVTGTVTVGDGTIGN